jgi:hypothetical protein
MTVEMTEFQIEHTFEAGGKGYVVARILNTAGGFEVSPDAKLGGCPVERWLDMPRSADASGEQRKDLFGFCLVTITDLGRLKIGDRAVLT